jgi:exodeoxyribonuclease VII large subunit
MQDPKNYIEDRRVLLDYAQSRLIAAAERKTGDARRQFVALASSLDAMSPLKVLGRGYAIARSEETGAVIRSADDVADGDRITVRLRSDELRCRVEERVKKRGKGL